MKNIRLSLPSHPRFLSVIRMAISQVAGGMRFKEEEVKNIALAVDEACTNVIKHAYDDKHNKRIILTATVERDRLVVTIRDFGKKTNPKSFESRPLKEVRPGGLGLYFIKKIMDEVKYDISSKLGTTLRLVKKCR